MNKGFGHQFIGSILCGPYVMPSDYKRIGPINPDHILEPNENYFPKLIRSFITTHQQWSQFSSCTDDELKILFKVYVKNYDDDIPCRNLAIYSFNEIIQHIIRQLEMKKLNEKNNTFLLQFHLTEDASYKTYILKKISKLHEYKIDEARNLIIAPILPKFIFEKEYTDISEQLDDGAQYSDKYKYPYPSYNWFMRNGEPSRYQYHKDRHENDWNTVSFDGVRGYDHHYWVAWDKEQHRERKQLKQINNYQYEKDGQQTAYNDSSDSEQEEVYDGDNNDDTKGNVHGDYNGQRGHLQHGSNETPRNAYIDNQSVWSEKTQRLIMMDQCDKSTFNDDGSNQTRTPTLQGRGRKPTTEVTQRTTTPMTKQDYCEEKHETPGGTDDGSVLPTNIITDIGPIDPQTNYNLFQYPQHGSNLRRPPTARRKGTPTTTTPMVKQDYYEEKQETPGIRDDVSVITNKTTDIGLCIDPATNADLFQYEIRYGSYQQPPARSRAPATLTTPARLRAPTRSRQGEHPQISAKPLKPVVKFQVDEGKILKIEEQCFFEAQMVDDLLYMGSTLHQIGPTILGSMEVGYFTFDRDSGQYATQHAITGLQDRYLSPSKAAHLINKALSEEISHYNLEAEGRGAFVIQENLLKVMVKHGVKNWYYDGKGRRFSQRETQMMLVVSTEYLFTHNNVRNELFVINQAQGGLIALLGFHLIAIEQFLQRESFKRRFGPKTHYRRTNRHQNTCIFTKGNRHLIRGIEQLNELMFMTNKLAGLQPYQCDVKFDGGGVPNLVLAARCFVLNPTIMAWYSGKDNTFTVFTSMKTVHLTVDNRNVALITEYKRQLAHYNTQWDFIRGDTDDGSGNNSPNYQSGCNDNNDNQQQQPRSRSDPPPAPYNDNKRSQENNQSNKPFVKSESKKLNNSREGYNDSCK